MQLLTHIHDTGVQIISLTFDGAASNITMIKHLGCSFEDINALKTTFPHPVTNQPVYVMPDACHMIKLVRNCFESYGILMSGDTNKPINWFYLQQLVEIQEKEGLRLGNKIRRRHINFKNKKMRV